MTASTRNKPLHKTVPDTMDIWDSVWRYDGLVFLLAERIGKIQKEKPIEIFVPGCGKGRIVRELLPVLEKSRVKTHVTAIDINKKSLGEFSANLIRSGFVKQGLGRFISPAGLITVDLHCERIENFLIKSKEKYFDVILCLLFFHNVADILVSLLHELYDVLSKDGVFVVDSLASKDDVLEAADFKYDLLDRFNRLDKDSSAKKWLNFHLQRLRKEGSYWCSIAKATDISFVQEALAPLFHPEITVWESTHQDVSLGQEHLPFWWNSNDHDQPAVLPSNIVEGVLNRVCIYSKKQAVGDGYWEILKKAAISESLKRMDWLLWFFHTDDKLTWEKMENFIHNTYLPTIMQSVVSSGILRFNTSITSFYIATGAMPDFLAISGLKNLHVLLKSSTPKIEDNLLYWARNIVLNTHIRKNITSNVVDQGAKTVISCENDAASVLLLKNQGYKVSQLPLNKTLKKLGKIADIMPKLAVERRHLTGWDFIEADSLLNTEPSADHIKMYEQALMKAQCKNPAVFLLSLLKNVVIIPLPGVFEYSGRDYNLRHILGIGFTVDKIDKETLEELETVQTLMGSHLRRFHDNYLSLIWIETARKNASKSAIAAIMARNMSHNIGSHVIPALNANVDAAKVPGPDSFKRFTTYLQSRMDYIAYAITTKALYGNGNSIEELINGWNKNSIVARGLAASENFDKVEFEPVKNGQEKNLVLMPMGELGKQAFYSILEGVARNIAKHEYGVSSAPRPVLKILLKILDDKDKAYKKVLIFPKEFNRSYKNAALKLGIDKDRVSENDARHKKLLKPDGTWDDKLWGIKEIRASALFLRQEDLSRIDDSAMKPLALDFEKVRAGKKRKKLANVIYLKKFKYIAIVTENGPTRIGDYVDVVAKEDVGALQAMYKILAVEASVGNVNLDRIQVHKRKVLLTAKDVKSLAANRNSTEKDIVLQCCDLYLEQNLPNAKNLRFYYMGNDPKKMGVGFGDSLVRGVPRGDGANCVIFIDHYFGEEAEAIRKAVPAKVVYAQDISVRSQFLASSLRNAKDCFSAKVLLADIKEAALIEPILICDERLYSDYKDEIYRKYYQNQQKIHIANLFIEPEVGFYNGKGEFVFRAEKVRGKIIWTKRVSLNKFSFICIHLGLIQKLAEHFLVKERVILDSLTELCHFARCRIVVHSGRGKAVDGLGKDFAYMDFASLQFWLKEGKVALVQGLLALT